MKLFICTLLLLLSTLPTAQDASKTQDIALVEQLKDVIQRQFAAFEDEDIGEIEATFHPDAPTLAETLAFVEELAATYDLEYSVGKHWIYIGRDDEYAYARVEQETRKLSGPAFSDNAVDQVWVFRQFEGEWRVWSTGVLSIDYF